MSNSLIKFFYLILKYAIKRKLNRIGYTFKRKRVSKSRKAIGAKGKGLLGTILGFFGVLYIICIGTFFIYSYTEQVKVLDQYKKNINRNKINVDLILLWLQLTFGS